jgi:hypothetical protein
MRPLLQGSLAREARASVDALSKRLLAAAPPKVAEAHGAGVGLGCAGIALGHAYLSRFYGGGAHVEAAEAMLAQAFEEAAAYNLGPSLHAGFPGIGWVVEHLGAGGAIDPNRSVDDAIAALVAGARWTDPFDVGRGLGGLVAYAIARAPRGASKTIASRSVEHLARISDGDAWITERRFAPKLVGRRYHDLGLLYGVPGIVAALAGAIDAGLAARKSRSLLGRAVPWLLAHDRDEGFARGVGPSFAKDEPPRAGLGHGDLAVALPVLLAARAADEPAWEEAALAIARRAAKRAPEGADASLRSGAAGSAHAFHRLYRWTGEKRFADAARACFAHALAGRAARGGFAGYRAWRAPTEPGTRGSWIAEAGLLVGGAGVGLALVAALSSDDALADWDKIIVPRK